MDEFNKKPNDSEIDNDKKDKTNLILNRIGKATKTITDKDGFYIILFLCICIVTTTAVWVSKSNYDKANKLDNEDYIEFAKGYFDDIDDLEEEDKNVTLIEKKEAPLTQDTKDKEAATSEEQMIKVTSTLENATQKQELAAVAMVQPVLGNIGMDYADNRLVYSKTLEQWTTHNGIDIKGSEGTAVKAVLDGTIIEVEKDTELGIVITIDHGNGLQTKYGCLSTADMVTVGKEVKKGDAISGIGKGVGIELADGPHLHFEVIKDGKNVNPKQFLPKLK